jgi:hypothetical protein
LYFLNEKDKSKLLILLLSNISPSNNELYETMITSFLKYKSDKSIVLEDENILIKITTRLMDYFGINLEEVSNQLFHTSEEMTKYIRLKITSKI